MLRQKHSIEKLKGPDPKLGQGLFYIMNGVDK